MSRVDAAHIPVLVGVGQTIERDEIVSVVDLLERATRAALEDAPGLAQRIERLTTVVPVFSPCGKAPSSELARRLGIAGLQCELSTVGGNTPQWLSTRAAADIADGSLRATLIVGAEATRSLRAGDPEADFLRAGLSGASAEEVPDVVVGPSMKGVLTRAEIAAGLVRPADTYPLFDSAIAAAHGRSPSEQRELLGHLLSPFTRVASRNPYAWFRKELTPCEIADPGPDNRLTAEPYTKRMNSFPNVDLGSALLLTTLEIAREAGLAEQCVFPWAGATTTDVPPVARPALNESPALRAAAGALFAVQGIGVDDLDWIDLYSCFPSAVEVGALEIGLAFDDPRGLTLTGGMPFFGGPGNNYTSHGIASAALRLRESGRLAYVSGNGGLLSKHSLGIYGSEPPPDGFRSVDTGAAQAELDTAALPVCDEASAKATVVASTVTYDRDGAVTSAPVIATLDDGRRVVAVAAPALLPELAGQSLVGRRISVEGAPPRYEL